MPARAIGTGTISFGLVAIPVKLYSASQTSERISFNLLHAKCSSRLKQQYICPRDNEIVDRESMIKGYEFSKGQYVTFSEEELKSLEMQRTEAIEIVEFLPESEIDPIYYDKAYYLGPDKGGDRPYALLGRALKESGRVALARYSARGKQHLVLVRAIEGGLVMQQLYYKDEVRAFSEVPVGESAPKPEELKLAQMLIEQAATEEFHPERYEDETRKKTLALIQQKVEGHEIAAAPDEEPAGQIIDLMEALRASLAKKKEAADAEAGTKAKKGSRAGSAGPAEIARQPDTAARASGGTGAGAASSKSSKKGGKHSG